MTGQIVRLRAEHFDSAMAFLNRCFGNNQDFATMLPSLYQPEEVMMQNNYAMMDGSEIRSIVGLFPIKLRVGDVDLRVAGIGGVSVAPEARGQNLMRTLMGHVAEQAEREGYELGFLSGMRQRYRHFGWDVAGTEIVVALMPKTCGEDLGSVTFQELEDDSPLHAELKALHDREPVHCIRTDRHFARFLRSWHRRGYAALDDDGKLLGYLVAGAEADYVPEIVAVDDDTLVRMARAWTRKQDKWTRFVLRSLPRPALFTLSETAEDVSVRATGNWRVFNFVKIANAALRLRHRMAALPEGEALLNIPGQQGATHLEVRPQSAGCAAREGLEGLKLEAMQATRLLFGPLEPGLVAALGDPASALQSWCPLPLGFSEQDRC